jgi:hypothetical protein
MSAERLLALMTAGLPPRRKEWGAAMRAELAAIDDPDARQRFARSAAAAAFARGFGLRLAFALGTGAIVAAVTVTVSRLQLPDGGPGVLEATVPVPGFLLLAVGFMAAYTARSFRFGLETGALALLACFAAVFAVVALEGLVWMDRHGVFVLDADPPRSIASDADVVFDLFTTGMWLGHLIYWAAWPVIGAWVGARRAPTGHLARTP